MKKVKGYEIEQKENASMNVAMPNHLALKGSNLVEPLDFKEKKMKLVDGRTFTQEEIDNDKAVGIISKKVAEANGVNVGDQLVLDSVTMDHKQDGSSEELYTQDHPIEIIGIFEPVTLEKKKSDDKDSKDMNKQMLETEQFNTAYLPNGAVASINKAEYEKGKIALPDRYKNSDGTEMTEEQLNPVTPTFILKSPEDVEAFKEEAKALIPDSYKLNASTDEYDQVGGTFKKMSQISGYVVLLAIGAALLIISLVVILFLRDRKHELGIYLSLGNILGKMVSDSLIASDAFSQVDSGNAGGLMTLGSGVGQSSLTMEDVSSQSGSGKTTFLSLISALDEPKSGEVLYNGKNIKTIGMEKYRRDDISIIFQSYNLVPYLTGLENVLVAMSITDNEMPKDSQAVAYNLLDYIGINKIKADRLVGQLSGGEQQRIAIARALATNVDIILADEPTGNLDEGMEQEIVTIFKDLATTHNKCVIVVTHSNEIAKQSDKTYFLKQDQPKEKDETLLTTDNNETPGPKNQTNNDSTKETRSNNFGDGTEFDPTYHQKKKKKQLLIGLDEYSEAKPKGEATRFEIVNKDVTKETYKRKDKANMYYSKGKETFEKNIAVPDFKNKMKSEVESWAKTNEINVTYEESSSADIPADSIISQSIDKDQKIAKKDSLTVTVSLGKGFVVPNFAEYTQEAAGTAVNGLEIQAKAIFTENVPYGQLISQSVAAGTELTSKDDLKVKVFYSAGQPYLKDLRGNTLEGDLPKQFYDEFQSKGANIKYTVRYVDSAEPKGTVVRMSAYNLYVPLNYTVALDISLGNLEGASSYTPKAQDKNTEKDNEPQSIQQ
ncbi:hypothetical protein HW555_014402 [Spodoptera exigua]|uniref:ABC transporter domain-containing protein n=1 Tax=Spodoptera exigua TaxID=7107 RepID=A0A835G3U4_SPOEX|nr:hypothetical protein HW555_014402 [Spodoptera exigua]